MWGLVLPHFGLGLGIGVVDSSLMPLLARLVEVDGHGGAYGPVYAVAQTAVSLAYGLGPFVGGAMAEYVGFANVMRMVAAFNVAYAPMLVWLKRVPSAGGIEDEGEDQRDIEVWMHRGLGSQASQFLLVSVEKRHHLRHHRAPAFPDFAKLSTTWRWAKAARFPSSLDNLTFQCCTLCKILLVLKYSSF